MFSVCKNKKKFIYGLLNYSFNNIITHVPIHRVRVFYLRLFNKNIHPSVVMLLHTRILNFWRIVIKEGVVINQYCVLDCRVNTIYIGEHTDIGAYTRIWTLGHNPDSQAHSLYGGDVVIGHHVWIATNVTILPNITIANGTVIAASTVVHKNTNINDIIAGNPGRFIRKRNNDLTYKLNFDPFFE